MSGDQFKTHPSFLDEINMLVKGNEDLSALISDVLRKRRTFPNSLEPVGTGLSTERPSQILMAPSTESYDAVRADELPMCPATAIGNVVTKLSKVALFEIESSPLSSSYGKFTMLRAYEDFADDEASSDDSGDSLSSWLTIDSSDEDSKYPSTLDDDYDGSSSDESSESGSVYEESLRSRSEASPGGEKDRNGNFESVDACDGESKHYSSTTESSSEIEALKGENKSVISDDSSESVEKSSDGSKTVDSCDEELKHYSSPIESNNEIEAIASENKSVSSDDSSESDEKSSDGSKAVDSCDEELKHCSSPTESNSEIEAIASENKSVSSDDSSESDEKSSDGSKAVDSCDEGLKHYSSPTESNSEIEVIASENKSVSSDDSSESDEKSSDSSKTVDSCDEELKQYSFTESDGEIEGENDRDSVKTSADDSSESDGNSSDYSTREKCSVEEADGGRIMEEKDSSEESDDDESSEPCTSESEPPSNDIESNTRDSSRCEASIVKSDGDSTDSSTSVSLESSDSDEAQKSGENQSRENRSESGQWSDSESGGIEPRSDWGESSLIQSDDSLVCIKAGKDKIIISKKNKIGEIQSIYFFPHFLKWRGRSENESADESTKESDSKVVTPAALSSSNESEPPPSHAAEPNKKSKVGKKIHHRQHKRCNKHRVMDQLVDGETSSSDVNFLKSEPTGAMCDSTSINSSDESEDNTENSPSYKKYSSISEDLSPSNEFIDGQRGPESHKSNTYRKFMDVDGRM